MVHRNSKVQYLVQNWTGTLGSPYIVLIFHVLSPISSHSCLLIHISCIESSRTHTTPPRHDTSRGSSPGGVGRTSGLMVRSGARCWSCDKTLELFIDKSQNDDEFMTVNRDSLPPV